MMRLNFALMQHHNYSLHDIEHLMPWEREVYVGLLLQYIEEEKMKDRHEKLNRQAKGH